MEIEAAEAGDIGDAPPTKRARVEHDEEEGEDGGDLSCGECFFARAPRLERALTK